MREIVHDSKFKWLMGLFVFLTGWFVVEKVFHLDSGRILLWTNFYFPLPLYGAICAIFISRQWGGTKSTVGKTIIVFAVGLLAQVWGQISYSYLTTTTGDQMPYPSIGDIGYFGSIIIYIYGLILLARAVGISFFSKSVYRQTQIIVITIALVVLPWLLFLRSYTFDFADPLRTGLDIAYLIGEALYVSMSVIILLFVCRNKKLGHSIRQPILWVLAALMVQYIADFNFLYQSQPGKETWAMGQYGDFIYLIAYLIMSFALLQFRTNISFPISTFSQLAKRIIEEQERIVGPLAWQEARRVKGLNIDPETRAITFGQTPQTVIEHLLDHYETIFGRSAREACRGIVNQFIAQLPPEQQSVSRNEGQRLEYINEELYRQNAELSAKNKTLALLRQLHSISLLALKPEALASTVVKTLQLQLGAETVAILVPTADGMALQPLALAESTACGNIRATYQFSFADLAVSLNDPTLIAAAWRHRSRQTNEQFLTVWGNGLPAHIANQLVRELAIRSTVVYPLASEGANNGVLVIVLNRLFVELPPDEQEMIDSVADVIAAALRQALLYEQLAAANRDLRQLNEQQSQFLTDIAHELQSPLAIVTGNVEALALKYADEQKIIDVSHSSLRRLSQLITNLLLLAKADFGILQLNRQPQDVCRLLQKLYEETEVLADDKKIAYRYACDSGGCQANIDGDKIKGACLNILSNAFKYTPDGGTVTMTAAMADNNIEIRFFNSGSHIPAEDMAHLFERFYRREIHEQQGKKGTGLGLAIAKTVIEEHGGTITVNNVDPEGVEFVINMPTRV